MRLEPTRTSRRSALALAALCALFGVAWLSWSSPARDAVAARPERALAPAASPAEIALLASDERAPVLALAAEAPETAAVAADIGAESAGSDSVRTNVRVRVLGIELGERAVVEARVYGKGANASAHVLREVDEKGELALALPPGQLRLGAWTEAKMASPLRTELGTKPASFELQLARAGLITGRVTNALTGAPIAGASITVLGFRELDAELSDSDGRYELAVPTDGMGRPLRCEAEGFARESTSFTMHTGGRWHAHPGAQIELGKTQTHLHGGPIVDFALLPARTITGELHDARGALAGATVTALGHVWTAAGLAFPDQAEASSAETGHFALKGLRPDIDHFLTVELPGYAQLRVRVPPSTEASQDLGRLQVEAACELEVRVVDPDGLPVEDVVVALEFPLPTAQGRRIPSQDEFPRNALRFANLAAARRVRTLADGSARFEALAAGTCSIRVAGGSADTPASKPVWVDVGVEPRVELRVELAARMSGHVLADGHPVAGARVNLREGAHRGTTSQPDGSFRFTGLDPAPAYTLHAHWTDAQGIEWSCADASADWREPQVLVLRADP